MINDGAPCKADLLNEYLAAERLKPFAWGAENGDCLLFLLGWAEKLGRMASVDWRGMYRTEQGARASLEWFGGAIAAVTDVLGPPRIGSNPLRGDVGLIEIDGWHLGVICTGEMWVLRAGEAGVRFMKIQPAVVWPTGFLQ